MQTQIIAYRQDGTIHSIAAAHRDTRRGVQKRRDIKRELKSQGYAVRVARY